MRSVTPIRVLLVDDSVVVRHVVRDILVDAGGIEVVGAAKDGRAALECLERLEVDVVVLDVEMPVLNGLATLEQLRPRWPELPVIMFSTLTERGASATLDALALGASDYLAKPSSLESRRAARDAISEGLVPLVRHWGRAGSGPASRAAPLPPVVHADAPAPQRWRAPAAQPAAEVAAVVIGCSTGGPNALAEIVPALPASLGIPVLVVQHMPPTFTRLLAERLDQRSNVHVCEGAAGTEVRAGHVYVAPGGVHMTVRRAGAGVVLAMDDGPAENSVKPAVDVLLRGAVDTWSAGVLSVILTGMGSDGLAGSRAVVAAGGRVLAQDEASSVVWGMPGAVSRAGLVHDVVPLEKMAEAIVWHSRSFSKTSP